jgi:hypothetical protein
MKGSRIWMSTLMVLISALPAYAVDTTKTYQSGILVLVFLGVCALIVVAQLMPSLILLFSWIKGLSKHTKEKHETTEGHAG